MTGESCDHCCLTHFAPDKGFNSIGRASSLAVAVAGAGAAPGDRPQRDVKATLSASATVVKRPLAQNDKTVTSMVPASVLVRREAKPKAKGQSEEAAGFGLAPAAATAKAPAPAAAAPGPAAPRPAALPASGLDANYAEFMATMAELGALE